MHCAKELEPQFIETALPANLLDGRRRAEREAWEKEHPKKFTGGYGRFHDNRFCGMACGYNWAIKHAGQAPQETLTRGRVPRSASLTQRSFQVIYEQHPEGRHPPRRRAGR
jgi:hypothetical protein